MPEDTPVKMRKDLPVRLRRAEEERSKYSHVIPPNTPLEHVMTSDYWVHVKNYLALNDVIEVIAADGTYDADIRVISLNKVTGIIKFRLIRNVVLDANAEALPKPGTLEAGNLPSGRYQVKRGFASQFKIIERATGNIVADGLDKQSADAECARLEAERKAA